MLNDENRARMSENLLIDIKGGAFAKEWSKEQAGGGKTLEELRNKEALTRKTELLSRLRGEKSGWAWKHQSHLL